MFPNLTAPSRRVESTQTTHLHPTDHNPQPSSPFRPSFLLPTHPLSTSLTHSLKHSSYSIQSIDASDTRTHHLVPCRSISTASSRSWTGLVIVARTKPTPTTTTIPSAQLLPRQHQFSSRAATTPLTSFLAMTALRRRSARSPGQVHRWVGVCHSTAHPLCGHLQTFPPAILAA